MAGSTKRRLTFKLDAIFWFVVSLLPILVYFVLNYRNPSAPDFFTYISGFAPFTFIQDILDDVTDLSFGATFKLNAFLAYCVGVEILHVLFDVIVFIPRLAHKWISKAVQDD